FKKRKLEKGMSVDIQVGDRVLQQNVRSRQRKGGKLDPDYLGPYTVVRVEGKSLDVVNDEGKQIPKINIDHLIHFLEDHPPKVHKFFPPATVHSDPHVPPEHLQSPALQAPLKFMSFLHPVTLPYTHLSLQHIPISLTVPFSVPIPHVGNHPATQYSVLFNPTPAGQPFSKSISAACLDSQPISSPATQCTPRSTGLAPQPTSSPATQSAPPSPGLAPQPTSSPATQCAPPSPGLTPQPTSSPATQSAPPSPGLAPQPTSSPATQCTPPSPGLAPQPTSSPATQCTPRSTGLAPQPASSPATQSAPPSPGLAPQPTSSPATQCAQPSPGLTPQPTSSPATQSAPPSPGLAPQPTSSPATQCTPRSTGLAPQPTSSPATQSAPPSPGLAPQPTSMLQDIWAGKIGGKLCSKVGPYKVFTSDLERLKPGEKLE
ncbi:hypothetical protein M9458_056491, partial [Cirrhinus mrigala]